MMRLRLTGCARPSLKCLADVLKSRDAGMIEDYFTEVAQAAYLPYHPGEEPVDVVVEERSDSGIGAAKIIVTTTDGERRRRYVSYCYEVPGTGLVCVPGPCED